MFISNLLIEEKEKLPIAIEKKIILIARKWTKIEAFRERK